MLSLQKVWSMRMSKRALKIFKIRVELNDLFQDDPGAPLSPMITFRKYDDGYSASWSFSGRAMKTEIYSSLDELFDFLSNDWEIYLWKRTIRRGLGEE